MHANKDDLEYTADGIRDRRNQAEDRHIDFERSVAQETHVQASMQEETAKAIHRLAEATERQNELLEELVVENLSG